MTMPAYLPPCSLVTPAMEVAAFVQILDPRARSASVLLSESSAAAGLRAGVDFIQRMALLPVNPEADAEFAKFKKTLVKTVPRRVIRHK